MKDAKAAYTICCICKAKIEYRGIFPMYCRACIAKTTARALEERGQYRD